MNYDEVSLRAAARAAHEANRAYCFSIGDESQPAWDDAPAWQKKSAILGAEAILLNWDLSPAESHASWLAQKQRDGWKYGPEKSALRKEHPCCVPYAELPPEQRVKDSIFGAVVRAMLSARQHLRASRQPGGLPPGTT